MSSANGDTTADTDGEGSTDNGDDEGYVSIIKWALDNNYIVETESGAFRFVETGFLAGREEMRGYLKGVRHARYIATDNYPIWNNDTSFVAFTDEVHENVSDLMRDKVENLKKK